MTKNEKYGKKPMFPRIAYYGVGNSDHRAYNMQVKYTKYETLNLFDSI